MPRVNTAIAAKDYPEQGIKKGDKYWHWTPFRGCKHRSATMPRPSQVEPNEQRANIYGATESLSDFLVNALAHPEDITVADIEQAVEDAKEIAETAAEEANEKADNMEEGFGHETEQSQGIREMAEEIENWVNELESFSVDPDDTESTLTEMEDLTAGPQI